MWLRISLLLLLTSLGAQALETDNYLVWNRELKDSAHHIDRYFSETISAALKRIPDHEKMSCEQVTMEVSREFISRLVHDNPVENWLFSELDEDEMFPRNLNYVEESIYREPYRFYIPWFGLAPNIQVNGFYFGTDKLSHFASTGRTYFKIYRKHLAGGSTSEDAEKKAIDWGIQDEKTLHGFWASGVFSYADLEANYQGLKFYKDLCEKNHLQKIGNAWVLSKETRISDYVGPGWDETFEASYRQPGNWQKVAPALKNIYCPVSGDPAVIRRMRYYRQNFKPSLSRSYLDSLSLPEPQSFSALCEE